MKIAVFLVLAIHGIGLMALLMQGCKREPDNSASAGGGTNDVTNSAAPIFNEPTNTFSTATNAMSGLTNTAPPVSEPTPPVMPPAAPATEYVIVKGDTFSTIAKKFHVSIKALQEANPAVEPTKLKIGQSVHIPAASATAGSTSAPAGSTTAKETTGSGQMYTVKSGDSLTKIANEFGVSIKALRSSNNLKTDKIVVGQKLSIPGKSVAGTNPVATPPASGAGQ